MYTVLEMFFLHLNSTQRKYVFLFEIHSGVIYIKNDDMLVIALYNLILTKVNLTVKNTPFLFPSL